MNKPIIAAISLLVAGALLGWTVAKVFGNHEEERHPEAPSHARHEVHGEEGHEEAEHDQGGNGENGRAGKMEGAHEEDETHEEHGEGGAEPGVIPDSILAVAGISIDSAHPATLSQILHLPGAIKNDGSRSFTATARFAGVVREWKLRTGDRVAAGAVVAVIESDATLETYQVKASRSGTVLHHETSVGETVAAGQVLAELSDLGTVVAELKAGSHDLEKLKVGQNVSIQVDEHKSWQRSKISRILPQVDPATQTRSIQVELSNSQGFLAQGLFVQGLVEVGENRAQLTIPVGSVQASGGSKVVYVREGQRFEERKVVLGRSDADRVEVVSGLKRGEKVAAAGSFVVKADLGKSEAEHVH